MTTYKPEWNVKYKSTALILITCFLGIFGAYRFYIGDKKLGIFYLICCCTLILSLIPIIMNLIDLFTVLTTSSREFKIKHTKRYI